MKCALLVLIVLWALASFACGNGASSSTDQTSTATPAPLSLEGTPSSGLPPCQSSTATNCDPSNLRQAAGTHGSPGCTGNSTAMIGASPIDLNEILYVQPMGLMIGGHV